MKQAALIFFLIISAICFAGEQNFDKELGEMNFYYGNFHSHTQFSDGRGTPAEAFTWARDKQKYDFYFITDHALQVTGREWKTLHSTAKRFNKPGEFAALIGFEYTNEIYGHINVFLTSDYQSAPGMPHLESFYKWADRNHALLQFNHPSSHGNTFRNLVNYDYVQDNFFAIETGNGRTSNNSGRFAGYYHKALDKGFKVCPTNNMDNHRLAANSFRSVVIAPKISDNNVITAMRKRRIFSADDPDIQIIFKMDDYWMGSTAYESQGYKKFKILVKDNEPIDKVQLISNYGNIIEEIYTEGKNFVEWYPEVFVKEDRYFFVRTIGRNTRNDEGDANQMCITAPIWLDIEYMQVAGAR